MSEHRRLADADLISELRRRSTGPAPGTDLSVRDFVGGVDAKLDSGAALVPVRRLPAFAGLAGAAAILLVLVVALPRLGPGGPSPSPSLLAALPSTISTMPVREFAARVAAGELRGETVLVNARIASNPAMFVRPCPPPGPCYLGDLEGTDPPMAVQFRWLPTGQGQGTELTGPGINPVWGWWHRPETPLEGAMVLSADDEGKVFFLGRNPAEEIASSLSEIAYVDFDAMPLEEIRVVPAWLTGIVAPISCTPPEPGTYIAYLPGRYCGNPSWLAPNSIAVDPNGYTIPEGWLQVQSNAYLDFAPSPAGANGSAEPRAGLYVIAKRLEGSGCPNGPPPCWQWQIVGRVTINGDGTQAQPLATPTPPASAAPVTRSFACLGDSISVTFEDTTGLVSGCSVVGVDRHNPNGATNPNGDLSTLQVLWGSSRCITSASVEFKRAGNAYIAHVTESGPDCESSSDGYLPEAYAVLLALSAPVRGEAVSVSVLRDLESPATSAKPVATIECTDPPDEFLAAYGHVTFEDETGLVDSCETIAATGQVAPVFNPRGNTRALQIEWDGRPCDARGIFTLSRSATGFTLLETFYERTCRTSGVRHSILLTLSEDIEAGSVVTSQAQIPLPPPTPPSDGNLTCPYGAAEARPTEVTVLDHTGLFGACQASASSGEITPEPTVDETYHSSYGKGLYMSWEVPAVCTHLPARIEVFARLTEEPGTRYTIHVDLLEAPVGEVQACHDAVSTQSVGLYPMHEIAPDAVDLIVTRGSVGLDSQGTDAGTFTLRLIADATEYAADQPMDIRAELTYDGPSETVGLSGAGLVNGFGVYQLDGPFSLDPIWPLPCGSSSLTSGVALVVEFGKSGGVSADDPLASVYRAFLDDPELRLTPGTWKITAFSGFMIGDGCGGERVNLKSSVVIHVR